MSRKAPEGASRALCGDVVCLSSATGEKQRQEDRREFNITPEEVYGLWEKQGGLCALTGLPMQHHPAYSDMNASMDRKEGSIGYVIDNVQLVCWRINEMKNDQPEHQLLWWARALVANDENHRRSSAEA